MSSSTSSTIAIVHARASTSACGLLRGLTINTVATLTALLTGCSAPAVMPAAPASALLAPAPYAALDIGRGQLFYDAQCGTCHTAQMHWRENSIVNSWVDVVMQVDRWQQNSQQHWGPWEIGDVAAYLNATYYQQPCSIPGCLGRSSAMLDGTSTVANSHQLDTELRSTVHAGACRNRADVLPAELLVPSRRRA